MAEKIPREIRSERDGLRLAARMREVREGLGYTQAQMAFFFKISRESYWRWERFSPPENPPVRMWCKHVLRQLSKTVHDRKRYAKEKKARREARLADRSD